MSAAGWINMNTALFRELDPRAAGETSGGQLNVIVQYVEKQQVVAGQERPGARGLSAAAESLLRLEGPGGSECRR